MIKNNSKIIDGWTIHFEEVSNNVYKVELIDNFGRQADRRLGYKTYRLDI
jgi:hypothetical protein